MRKQQHNIIKIPRQNILFSIQKNVTSYSDQKHGFFSKM